uniref:Uncharacterized protein n=1 Tax=Arundo donax TaxID=35708 RepID=A0A0A9G6V8_ARUDO
MARTTLAWPFSLANSSAVLQSSFVIKGLAPCERSRWTVCSSPFLAAWCNAVPQCDPGRYAFTFAPNSISILATLSRSGRMQATISGVFPSLSIHSRPAPCARRVRIPSTLP